MSEQQRQEYEEMIGKGLDEYEQAVREKSLAAPKKLKQVDGYLLYYQTLARDDQTRLKLQQFKKQKNQIKSQGVRSAKKEVAAGFNAENQRANEAIAKINQDLDDGTTLAEKIEQELNSQIEALDKIYEQNMEGKTRLKRIKQSLLTILRRIYTDKLTCCLLVLLLLGIIALIVVHFVHTKQTP